MLLPSELAIFFITLQISAHAWSRSAFITASGLLRG
jgi:hypothetical protein